MLFHCYLLDGHIVTIFTLQLLLHSFAPFIVAGGWIIRLLEDGNVMGNLSLVQMSKKHQI